MAKRYPEELRRKVLDLVAVGRPITQIADDPGVSDQTIYNWRKQELVELTAATNRIRGLESEGRS